MRRQEAETRNGEEGEKNGFATPAGTISGSQPDVSNEPFSDPNPRRDEDS